MPCRLLREGILSSERINRLSWEAEVFYRRLMSVVDDYGRFSAHPTLLRAALYPLRLETVRDSSMERLLADVEQARLVRIYEVSGKRYVELLDFRQHIRSKLSKFPQPPDESAHPERITPASGANDARHLQSNCTATARLDEGGDEDVIEGGGEGEPGTAAACTAPGASANPAPPLPVQLALALRERGVSITSAHPKAHEWAARRVTVAQALEAVAVARLRKPQGPIAPNYLAPILEEILAQPAGGKGRQETAWWASEAATLAKGRELGLSAHPGEAMAEFRARISAAANKARA